MSSCTTVAEETDPRLADLKWIPIRKETTNDTAEATAKGAIKYDAGKAPINRGCLAYFPRAMAAVATVSAFGASKYAWKGWEGVDDGINRYSDAMVRHVAYEGQGEVLDPDSGLLHAAHAAWNALARLELIIKEQNKTDLSKMLAGVSTVLSEGEPIYMGNT